MLPSSTSIPTGLSQKMSPQHLTRLYALTSASVVALFFLKRAPAWLIGEQRRYRVHNGQIAGVWPASLCLHAGSTKCHCFALCVHGSSSGADVEQPNWLRSCGLVARAVSEAVLVRHSLPSKSQHSSFTSSSPWKKRQIGADSPRYRSLKGTTPPPFSRPHWCG